MIGKWAVGAGKRAIGKKNKKGSLGFGDTFKRRRKKLMAGTLDPSNIQDWGNFVSNIQDWDATHPNDQTIPDPKYMPYLAPYGYTTSSVAQKAAQQSMAKTNGNNYTQSNYGSNTQNDSSRGSGDPNPNTRIIISAVLAIVIMAFAYLRKRK